MKLVFLIKQLANACPHNMETLASMINQTRQLIDPFAPKLGAQTLTNKLNPDSSSHNLTVGELVELADVIGGHVAIANWFAQQANAVCVPLPESANIGDMGLLDSFMQASVRMGGLAMEFQKAYADGDIDQAELQKIKSQCFAACGDVLAFFKNVEQVAR